MTMLALESQRKLIVGMWFWFISSFMSICIRSSFFIIIYIGIIAIFDTSFYDFAYITLSKGRKMWSITRVYHGKLPLNVKSCKSRTKFILTRGKSENHLGISFIFPFKRKSSSTENANKNIPFRIHQPFFPRPSYKLFSPDSA